MLQIYEADAEAALEDIEPDTILIDSKTLARIVSMSPNWVAANRHRIIGAQKVGGRWRFNLDIIRARLASGRDIIATKYQKN